MTIKSRLNAILEKISLAALRSERSSSSVHLVAVTKTVPVEKIIEAIQAGVRIIGENRVQEALPKIKAIESRGMTPEWHYIGKLQRNKVKQVVGRFVMIHSVDSLSLAEEISRQGEKKGFTAEILLEVNLSGESTKEGFSAPEVLALFDSINQLKYVKLKGLMTVPPPFPDPERSRPWFKKLKALGGEVESRLGKELGVYSMGMSNDYEVAIEEGATHVRIGRALFGERI
jgi:pyridoxal phosphate enzyme (YggS family)